MSELAAYRRNLDFVPQRCPLERIRHFYRGRIEMTKDGKNLHKIIGKVQKKR